MGDGCICRVGGPGARPDSVSAARGVHSIFRSKTGYGKYVWFKKYNAGDERRVATLSVLGWARVGRCTSTVQYLLHRTSTAAHSRPRSATVFAATDPRLTSLFLTLSPMVCCIRQRRLLQCLKGSSFGQHFVVVHYCRQPAATCLLYFNSALSTFFSCSLPEPYSLVLRCCCAAVTQRHLDSCSSTTTQD